MDLSIVIINYRDWNGLSACLDSFSIFKGTSFKYEIIIVDNSPDDGFIDEFESHYRDFIFIRNNINGGFAHGCNLGSTRATGEFILFLNPDTVTSEQEVRKLLERAKANPGILISSCRQVDKKGKEVKTTGLFPSFGTLMGIERAVFRMINKKKLLKKSVGHNNIVYPDWVSGSAIMIKKDILLELKGWDEDYWMYFEDTDLCRRARNFGGEVACFMDITIQHNHGGSSRIDLKTTALTKTEVNISRHLYISKHKKGFERTLIQVYLVLNNLVSGTIICLAGIVLFFYPRMFVRTLIYSRLTGYYAGALARMKWISPRSVNFRENDKFYRAENKKTV